MEVQPENQDQEKKPVPEPQKNQIDDNENLAREIPTASPDRDNLEPGPNPDNTK